MNFTSRCDQGISGLVERAPGRKLPRFYPRISRKSEQGNLALAFTCTDTFTPLLDPVHSHPAVSRVRRGGEEKDRYPAKAAET